MTQDNAEMIKATETALKKINLLRQVGEINNKILDLELQRNGLLSEIARISSEA